MTKTDPTNDGRPTDRALDGVSAEYPAPPPGPSLQAAIAGMQPVRTRVPARTFAALVAVGAGTYVVAVSSVGVRPDAEALPHAWLLGVGLLWLLGGPLSLARAVLPRPGHVLPDAARAGQTALLLGIGLVLFGFVATPPGENRVPASFLAGLVHCGRLALFILLPILVVGVWLLRPLQVVGMGKLAAALGAAGGAWAGVTLHTV
ncbi:MAG TPA: hypothetical protein VGG33_00365, partial [Polyangia bacterium]